MSQQSLHDLRALARGYQAMFNVAVAALLHIADETPSQSECVAAAEEALRELGVRDE